MNNNNTAVDKEKADNPFTTKSEYKIGHTFYTVTTVFSPVSNESLSEIMSVKKCSVNPDKNLRSRLCNISISAHCH